MDDAREVLDAVGVDQVMIIGDGEGGFMASLFTATYSRRVNGIGLHTGELEYKSGDTRGIALHLAARIMATAGPNEICVSRTVKDLVIGSGIEFSNKGEYELKGIPDKWQLFSVLDKEQTAIQADLQQH